MGSLVFTGLQNCYEELLFRKYSVDVFQLVGMEGIFGLAMNLSLVLIFTFIPCPWDASKCGGGAYLESLRLYFKQLSTNGFLLALCIIYIFTIAISVSLALTITKKINSVSRALANISRTVLVWVFGFAVTKFTTYKLEA